MAILKCWLSELCCQGDLWLFQETKYLDVVCEQSDVACLMATWTSCVPETGVLCTAQRRKWLHLAGLGGASRKYKYHI